MLETNSEEAQRFALSAPLPRKSTKDSESVFMLECDMCIEKSEKLRDEGANIKGIWLMQGRKVPLTRRKIYYD